MATKARKPARRNRRRHTHRIARVALQSWVVVLVSHTIATVVVMLVERLLHVAWVARR
jgi:hypothetical protein